MRGNHKMGISIKDTTTGTVIDLPPELFWQDEFDWCRVKSSHARGLTGSLIVAQSIAKGGRPMTLSVKDDMNWVKRSVVESLLDLANSASTKLEVTLSYPASTRTFTAIFNRESNPIEAKPVKEYESPNPDDDFRLTLHLLEIEA